MFTRKQIADIVERAVSTYVQTFLGLWAASGLDLGVHDLATAKIAAIGALPAALSVLKGLAAAGLPVGDGSASILSLDKIGRVAIPKIVEAIAPEPVVEPVVETVTVRKAPAKKAASTEVHPAKKAPAKKAAAVKKAPAKKPAK